MARKVPYGIQQPPGAKNALGEVKFLFPNTHNIYMHDTPNRELFEEDARAFSHGCVRVQNPREFAAVLLGWDAAERSTSTSRRQKSENGAAEGEDSRPPHLFHRLAGRDGQDPTIFEDIYGRDKAMEDARSAVAVAQR